MLSSNHRKPKLPPVHPGLGLGKAISILLPPLAGVGPLEDEALPLEEEAPPRDVPLPEGYDDPVEV